jgi:SH3 domain-containing YSC84-like protein 1
MMAAAGGSGVVVARLPDGSWSAPSAFSVRTVGVGGVYGIDVYDCVCVLNTKAAVDAYTEGEMSMAAGATMTAGPVGGNLDLSTKEVKPVWTYTKSRGLYGGLRVDGTMIREKSSTNAEAYGSKITVQKILAGEATWPTKTQLHEVLKAAEGKRADAAVLGAVSSEPTPGDLVE